MFAIARNLMIDHTRKRTTLSLDEATDPDKDRPLEIAADMPSPFDHFRSGEQAARIGQALLALHPLYREVLVLRFHEEMSLEEIAQVSSAPLSTVKSQPVSRNGSPEAGAGDLSRGRMRGAAVMNNMDANGCPTGWNSEADLNGGGDLSFRRAGFCRRFAGRGRGCGPRHGLSGAALRT